MRQRLSFPRWAAVVAVFLAPVLSAEEVRVMLSSAQASPLVLRVGQTGRVDGTSVEITFAAVRSDSRCPKDVRCIRAGEAVVALLLRLPDQEPTELTVRVPPGAGTTGRFLGYTIEVVDLDPQAQAGIEIAQDKYRLTVRVHETRDSPGGKAAESTPPGH